jgi:shikimate kinase
VSNRPPPRRVVLVGGMGVGKSTIGGILARRLRWRHIDLDAAVVAAAGCSVAEIFRIEGEAGFRRREAEATAALTDVREVVVTPGGGWVLNDALPRLLCGDALTVWLRASPETVLSRISARGFSRRPLLAQGDPAATLRRLAAERAPRYAAAADLALDVDGRNPAGVARRIEAELRRRGGTEPNR